MYVELWHLAIVIAILFGVGYYRDRQLQKMIEDICDMNDIDINHRLDDRLQLMERMIDKVNTGGLKGKIVKGLLPDQSRFSFRVERVDDGK